MTKEQRDLEDDAGVLDNEIRHADDQLGQLGTENNLDVEYDEANKSQGGPTDKKIATKATET